MTCHIAWDWLASWPNSLKVALKLLCVSIVHSFLFSSRNLWPVSARVCLTARLLKDIRVVSSLGPITNKAAVDIGVQVLGEH